MFRPIKEIADIWNNRLKNEIIKRYKSQKQFAEAYSNRYGEIGTDGKKKRTFQADVNKWSHVGEFDGTINKNRGFPTFKTMYNLSDFLGVSISYLIGETDYESFDMEKASKYTGLSEASIQSIRKITSGKLPYLSKRISDEQINSALNLLLENPDFVEYLRCLCEVSISLKELTELEQFKKVYNSIPERYREDAAELYIDSEDAIAKGIKPTDKLCKYAAELDDAAYKDICNSEPINEARYYYKANKYDLEEKHRKMVSGLINQLAKME